MLDGLVAKTQLQIVRLSRRHTHTWTERSAAKEMGDKAMAQIVHTNKQTNTLGNNSAHRTALNQKQIDELVYNMQF